MIFTLNISINKGTKIIANSYFRLQEPTKKAIALTNNFMFAYGSLNPAWFKDEKMYAIALLQHTGASLRFMSVERLKEYEKFGLNIPKEQIQEQGELIKKYKFDNDKYQVFGNAEKGFFSILPWDMLENEMREALRVNIDLENKTIELNVFNSTERNKFLQEQETSKQSNEANLSHIKEWPFKFPIDKIPFKDWDDVTFELLISDFFKSKHVIGYKQHIYQPIN